LVQFTRSDDFFQSMKQAQNYSSESKVRSDIIRSIAVSFAPLSSESKLILSIFFGATAPSRPGHPHLRGF